ncbi:hypothetical protein [Cellulomonas sp. KH9]|uniref:hypothetical protein n=1 Tax=Cellulomonas sp. KH9 TaxID=1855324 RepID=UPI0008E7B18F|nr:hypothetical protein [Cellulomonas sp. KH9]SFK19204.1 hypothetical protein SAMN05216467_2423 [Cellulomonas sp. KH9]
MTVAQETALSERFLTAWKRVERHLTDERASRRGEADMSAVLRRAEQARRVTPSVSEFLQACRKARNAYAHIVFDGYEGPVTLPPRPVVERLERIAAGLASPGRAVTVAPRAVTCTVGTPASRALDVMALNDLSQLPFRDPDGTWALFTRAHVSRLVHGRCTEGGLVLLDLSATVGDVVASVGSTPVTVLPWSSTAPEALEALEAALLLPDDEPGGYPAVLFHDEASDRTAIVTADDLPGLYDLLGR